MHFNLTRSPARERRECRDSDSKMIPLLRQRATLLVVATLLITLVGSPAAPAQKAPQIAFVYPAGGQQGTTFSVTIGGQNLTGANSVYFSGRDVQAKVTGYERPLTQKELNDLREKAAQLLQKRADARSDPSKPRFSADDEKEAAEIRQTLATRGNRQVPPAIAENVTIEVTLTASAMPGERELRLRTTAGLSNPLVFQIGQFREMSEPVVTAISNRTQKPRTTDPRSGRTMPGPTEITLPTVLNGQMLSGEVDRFRFSARKGQRLTFAVAARALIPYLADAVPGWFQATLALYDAEGREIAYNDDFRFNPDPVLSCEIPADGAYTLEIKDAIHRGREDFVYRITAGELAYITSIFPLGGPIAVSATIALAGWNLPRESLNLDTLDKKPGVFLLSVQEHGVLSNPIRFALDAQPDCTAAESREAAENGEPLMLPTIVNGRIDRPGDADVFRFEGKAGEVVVAEVLARRLGSPLDSILTVSDAAGRRLAANDDHEDKGAALLTHQADSRVEVTLPTDGNYLLRVSDTQHRGGPEYGYRLRVSSPRPDFELRVVPSTINVRAGAVVPLTVYALRRDGFSGEIKLALQDAPPGFALQGARIPANEEKITVTLYAPPPPRGESARSEPFQLSVAGVATIGSKPVMHGAVPADDMMQAFAYRHLVPARALVVNVAGRGSTLKPLSTLPARDRKSVV